MTVYGVKWHSDATSPTLNRLESNVGLTAGTSFDTLSPWTMRRCNLWDDGAPTAYYGDRCYTDTDVTNMGQCMVQVPKFWYCVDASLANHVAFYISDTETPAPAIRNLNNDADLTFSVHPAFTVDGATKDYSYIGAYEAYTNSSSLLESKADVAVAVITSPANYRTYAQARNTGTAQHWNLATIQQMGMLRLLFIVEYATLQSQASPGLGYGLTSATAIPTGLSKASGNTSVGDTAYATHVMSYRGVENLWGNYDQVVEGVSLVDYEIYIAQQATTAAYYVWNKNTSPYADTTVALPTSGAGSFSAVHLAPATVEWAFLAKTVSGTSVQYFCDRIDDVTGNAVLIVGGRYNSVGSAGLFSQNTVTSTGTAASVCARLAYLL